MSATAGTGSVAPEREGRDAGGVIVAVRGVEPGLDGEQAGGVERAEGGFHDLRAGVETAEAGFEVLLPGRGRAW